MASVLADSRGRRRFAAVAAVMLLAGAGCVSAGSSAPPSSPGASHSEIASPSVSPTASPTAAPTATPTVDLSNVPPAPEGEWKSIRWVQVPATSPVVAVPSPGPGASVETIVREFYVAGWSRGFVGFSLQTLTASESRTVATLSTSVATMATTYSSDGVHWHDGAVMQQPVSIDNLQVVGLFEGPSGLLAVGASGACGDSWIEALWTSPDGISWQKVDTKKAFGQAVVENVSGGSSGFVAVDETGHAVWTSRDGQSWRPVDLSMPAFATSRIDEGTAFAGGYVLAGSTVAVGARGCATSVADESATPTPAPPLRSPAAWWSADGATWTKVQLPGATSAYRVQMSVCQANDRTLIAWASYTGPVDSSSTWVSNDGRTWKLLAQPSRPSCYLLTDGRHSIIAYDPWDALTASYSGETSISMVTDDGALVAVAQEGDRPQYNSKEQWAVGPTGILWTDGSRLWIGLPSAG